LPVERSKGNSFAMAIKASVVKSLQMVSGALGNMVFQLFRNKLLALALGPGGVGWIALVNNLVETAAVVAGGGVSDSLNRELARRKPTFTHSQLISTGLGISAVLLAVAFPAAAVALVFTVPAYGVPALVVAALFLSILSATGWRLIAGCFLGLGMARIMATATISAAALNLVLTGALLAAGVRDPVAFVVLAPLCLIGTGLFFARGTLAENVRLDVLRSMPAKRPILSIALPVSAGLLLEPMTSFYVRSATGLRLGEDAVGHLQPGFLFIFVGAALFNTVAGITLVRWDQSHERAFSRKYLILMGTSLLLPVTGIVAVFLLSPIYPFLISLFFADAFRDGAAAVPWLLTGEVFRMAGAMLLYTFFSRDKGYITLLPRLVCLGTAIAMVHAAETFTLVTAAQCYAAAFGANFLVSLLLWIGFQTRLAREPIAS
jgi:O-antigen/teichoic acid export membrane protein